jgi:hypothetical protein
MMIIDHGPGVISDPAINWIKATEDVQLEIIDGKVSERHEQSEIFANICNINESWAAEIKDVDATEPFRDGPNMKLAAAQRDIGQLEE